jgi:hypothetical protein
MSAVAVPSAERSSGGGPVMSIERESERERVNSALVEALRKQVADLRERVDEQDERIANLEAQIERGGSSSGSRSRFESGSDGRDQAVIDQLDAGEVVTVSRLKDLYRTHTDIRTDRTLKNRVPSLLKRPDFEEVAFKKWQYLGSAGGEDNE